MSDRELLELAAKAAGYVLQETEDGYECNFDDSRIWNPLTDDGDAMRLAVKLGLMVNVCVTSCSAQVGGIGTFVEIDFDDDPLAATRGAIVRAAAEIGRQMP